MRLPCCTSCCCTLQSVHYERRHSLPTGRGLNAELRGCDEGPLQGLPNRQLNLLGGNAGVGNVDDGPSWTRDGETFPLDGLVRLEVFGDRV